MRLWVHAKAPFAAYRGLQAGVYRTTAPTMPPSAAYGLVLNLAGIETRDSTSRPVTRTRSGLPPAKIAIGERSRPEVSTLYQQLHSYPVGASGKELKERAQGAKYWIAPVRREILVGLDVVIGFDAEDESIADRVKRGVRGELSGARYGLPFAGDNSLLFDELAVLDAPPPVWWYTRIGPGDPPRKRSCRLTVGIDREDSSHTTAVLCAPEEDQSAEPPESAWVWVPSTRTV